MQTALKLSLLVLTPLATLAADEPSKPNIVVFLADDMGWGDSATYGHKLIQTPNLDKLASQGVTFTQCYSACGVCSPSRICDPDWADAVSQRRLSTLVGQSRSSPASQ